MPLFVPVPVPWSLTLGDMALPSAIALTANRAYFSGVTLPASATLTALRVVFGSGGNGSYDVGIYDPNGNLLNNRGATTSAAGLQTYTLATPLPLSAGRYWLAFWTSNAVDTAFGRANTSGFEVTQGVAATTNLPATMSGAVNGGLHVYVQALLSGGWS